MKKIVNELSDIVSRAFESCGYNKSLGNVTISDRMDLCQFQCNGAFAASKTAKKPPFVVADEVAAVLNENKAFSKVEVAKPGFLNLTVTDEFLLDFVRELSDDEFCGVPQAENPETIVIDYGGPNLAKALHIGHLRSAIIGESLKRLASACGNKAIGDAHLGDWGMPMGLVIAELRERNPEWRCFADDFDPAKDTVAQLDNDTLCEIYPFASAKSKTDEDFKQKAHTVTYQLQSRRPGFIALWKEILRASVVDLKENYKNLNVDFDYWYGESNADAYIPGLMKILEEKGLSYESEGALVVDVAEESDKAPMPPVIVQKSDKSSIYATTDLATIIQRNEDFHPQRIWYLADKRQALHFTQVFRCAKKADLVPDDTELAFLGFGTMNGSDGKPFKTRDGGVMRLSELMETVRNASLERLKSSAYVSEDDREDNARKLGMAAIKFGDLINQPAKDYIFDIEKFMSSDGKTGVYLLYTISRINSILKKAGADATDTAQLSGVYTDAERELMLKLVLSCEQYRRAFSEMSPNYICENAYQICVAFTKFYHDNHIMDEQDKAKRSSWIALITLVRRILFKHLDIIGIEPVENM